MTDRNDILEMAQGHLGRVLATGCVRERMY